MSEINSEITSFMGEAQVFVDITRETIDEIDQFGAELGNVINMERCSSDWEYIDFA